MSAKIVVSLTVAMLVLGACNRSGPEQPAVTAARQAQSDGVRINDLLSGEIFRDRGPELNVNRFLWQASLETLDFLPIASTDPFGGVITTDWGTPSGAGNERFRAVAVIDSDALAVSSLRVALFRQVLTGGVWTDAPVADATVRQIEDAILLRARQLRREDALQ
ncbi:DUF3576 domain-containing protein [Roseobacter sp. HKCCA0434]|uniref:DUF3576 domain-containing protein n=1 Tax=Roseobacter sp. HKCCA0434 TaxID=3079297 RepID=UPI0029058775|nr:DUF3576 domain-containing protein [Roseobacter sp. HKCCA0434]